LYTNPDRFQGDARAEGHDTELTGVLLTNLGTPDAPTASAVRRYLAEFLSDPRVIELPRWLWLPILYAIVLVIRPGRSASAYREIWTDEGSPLLVIARRQAAAVEERLASDWPGPVKVALGMRYGNPSIASAMEELRSAGARRLLVLPLYPQYSATTTGSTYEAVFAVLGRWRWMPELHMISDYHDNPGYIEALANGIREAWQRDGRFERLLFSFHGIPQRYSDAGDPYRAQCLETARLVGERLGVPADSWAVSFQSRVGREPWLEPYTDGLLESWAREGVRDVQVLCPGFSADCLETLEEIAIRGRKLFESRGGQRLRYIAALNDREDHVAALVDIVASRARGGQPMSRS
jgi:ferrochelatase